MDVFDFSAFKKSKLVVVEAANEEVLPMDGPAVCLACHHEWHAFVHAPAWAFECPECKCHRGHFKYSIEVGPGVTRYKCNCGSQLFQLTLAGTFCNGCGEHKYFDGTIPPSAA